MKKLLLACCLALGLGANAQITLGGATTTQGQPVPIDNNYGYSYVQQIFLKSDIKADAAGNITGLKFYLPAAAILTNSSNWTVYLGHTTKTAFTSTTDWIPVSASGLSQVFTGTVVNTAGVVDITLTTPFAYNNIDNLVVAVDENTAGFDSSTNRFYSYTGAANTTLYYRSDTVNPDPLAITQIGTRAAPKSKITFAGLVSSAPDCPAVSAPAANATGVSVTPTITWPAANNATGYRLSVGTTSGGTNILNNVDLGNVTSYTFSTALSPSTKYFYTVNSYSATIASSGCGERSFTTLCGPVGIPYVQNFESVTAPSIPACNSIQNAGTGNNWATYNFAAPTFGFSAGNTLRYAYSSTSAANAWYYTTPLNLVAGTSYVLSFRTGSSDVGYIEKLKVGYGTTAVNTAMTIIADYPAVEQGTSSVKKVVVTPSVSGAYYIGFNVYSELDQAYLYLDDIAMDIAPVAAPTCSAITSPAAGATNVSVRPTLSWTNSADAFEYKLYLGTTPGGNEVFNGVSSSSGLTLGNNPALLPNTTYYMKVIPTNNVGDASGCTEIIFTTGSNPLAPYCGPMVSSTPTQMAPITSVTFNGVTKDSDTSATTIGSFAPNESFVGTVIEVKNNLTTVPISITGIGIAGNSWAASVFIDWNNDNDFLDAGEAYFNTTATMKSSSTVVGGKVTLTGNIAVPDGVALGQKRMRIKYNYTGATINLPLTNACEDLTNGQVEDYTIDYTQFLAASDVSKASVSVYPNPFSDVLKISDVKGVKSVSISDVAGRLVKTMKASAELNVSDLKTGLYMVTLNMEDGSSKTIKAIKK